MICWCIIVVFKLLVLAQAAFNDTALENRGTYIADESFRSVSQNERIRFLILHYTAEDFNNSLKTLTQGPVSVHYLIPEHPSLEGAEPIVFQLVDESKRAWHAGVSNWKGRVNLNDASVGIEIVNLGYTDNANGTRTWYPYPEDQIDAVARVSKDIIDRYGITPDSVLGHSDVAPLRKQDPGRLFPWEELSKRGIGAWPDSDTVAKHLGNRSPGAPADILHVQQLLSSYGYDHIPQNGKLDADTKTTISAFQMHFRQSDISGNADAETEAIAQALLDKYA